MTMPVQVLVEQGYVSLVSVPALLYARKKYQDEIDAHRRRVYSKPYPVNQITTEGVQPKFYYDENYFDDEAEAEEFRESAIFNFQRQFD